MALLSKKNYLGRIDIPSRIITSHTHRNSFTFIFNTSIPKYFKAFDLTADVDWIMYYREVIIIVWRYGLVLFYYQL